MVKCFDEIEDFEERVRAGDFNIVFIYDDNLYESHGKDNSKQPVNGPKAYVTLDDVYANEINQNRNIGIAPIRKEDKPYLCVIDIDGETTFANTTEEKEALKLGTRAFIFEVLKNGFESRGITPLYVSSANYGFHIYLYITQADEEKHPIRSFNYPDLKNSQTIPKSDAYQQYPIIRNIASKEMASSAIEFFHKEGKYVVGPGSVIKGKKYNVLPMGAQRFKDITVYTEGKIEDLVEEILRDAQFVKHYNEQQILIEKKQHLDVNVHDLTPRNIKALGNLIIDAWPLIDGEKQMATVALGGFLSYMGVSQQSLIDIGNYVIDNKPSPNFFKMSDEAERTQGFVKSLLHDSVDGDFGRQKQGLTSLKERFKDKYDIYKMAKIIWINSNPKTHKFYPSDTYAATYPEIVLDFERKKIRYNSIRVTKDGPMAMSNTIIHHIVNDFSYINDISTPATLSDDEKPIQFYLENDNGLKKQFIYQNRADWFDQYHNMYGAYAAKGSKIPGYILMEYEDLGLVDTVETSSRPGIYMSKDQTTFRKFIETEDGIVECPSEAPDVDELRNALHLLETIKDVFPWKGTKFAATIKMSLLTPFGFVYKHYRRWIPGIVLIGESGALKSTMGELLCSLHTPINVNRRHYIMNGSEFNGEYRMGRDLNRHSYNIVVNECINMLSQPGNIEFLKDAIIEEFGRNPGQGPNGEAGQVYYIRSVPIFTLNNMVDGMEQREFARRFLTITLGKNDLYTTQQIEEKLSFLNKNGIVNKRFEELRVIGDFVFYFINQNPELFTYSIFTAIEAVINGLKEYSQMDLDWLDVDLSQYIDADIDESTQTDLALALKVIRQPFLQAKKHIFGGKSEEEVLSKMIGVDYDYILRTHTGVVITRGFEREFSNFDKQSTKTMRLEILGELITSVYELDTPIQIKKTKLVPTTHLDKKSTNGLCIEWEMFMELMGVDTSMQTVNDINVILHGDKDVQD